MVGEEADDYGVIEGGLKRIRIEDFDILLGSKAIPQNFTCLRIDFQRNHFFCHPGKFLCNGACAGPDLEHCLSLKVEVIEYFRNRGIIVKEYLRELFFLPKAWEMAVALGWKGHNA